VELDAGKIKPLVLKLASENRVTITHDGAGDAMESRDWVEEDSCDRCHSVGVADGDEVRRFGESIHYHEDHRHAIDVWEPLHEVHRNVGSHDE
jgi:hypothetical protein